mgnify:CR=1 FL=1
MARQSAFRFYLTFFRVFHVLEFFMGIPYEDFLWLLYRLYLFRILVQYETILLGLKDLLL